MNPGDKIKYSEHYLRPHRDYWLSCGRHAEKSAALEHLENLRALRGTVITHARNRFGAMVIAYRLDNGVEGTAMDYLFEKV
jgi:hypothetical protein